MLQNACLFASLAFGFGAGLPTHDNARKVLIAFAVVAAVIGLLAAVGILH